MTHTKWQMVIAIAVFTLIGGTEATASLATPSPRVALVTADMHDNGTDVLAIVEAQLLDDNALVLLERQQVDAVLAEHELSLEGLVDAEFVVQAGRLLAVELFAVLEPIDETDDVFGLVMFDATAGVRVRDVLVHAEAADAAETVAKAVRSAAIEHGDQRDKSHRPLALLRVRNVDLPRELDSACEAVGVLLERQLVRLPGTAVLERRRLEHLTRERALTGLPEDVEKLLASVLYLDLALNREADQVRAEATLRDAADQQIAVITATADHLDAAVLSADLVRQLQPHLSDLPADTPLPPADRLVEATRLAREAVLLNQHGGQYEAAVRAAESAYALHPSDHHLRTLTRTLVLFGRKLNAPHFENTIGRSGRTDADEANAIRGLHAVRRALDLRHARWQSLHEQGAPRWQIHQLEAVGGTDGHVESLLDVLADRTAPTSPDLATAADEIRQRYVAWSLMTVAAFADAFEQNPDPRSLGEYARRVGECGQQLLLASKNIAAFHTRFRPVLTRYLDLRTQHPIQQLEPRYASALHAAMAAPLAPRRHLRELPDAEQAEHARQLKAWINQLAGHPDPVVRVYGPLYDAIWKMTEPATLEEYEAAFDVTVTAIQNAFHIADEADETKRWLVAGPLYEAWNHLLAYHGYYRFERWERHWHGQQVHAMMRHALQHRDIAPLIEVRVHVRSLGETAEPMRATLHSARQLVEAGEARLILRSTEYTLTMLNRQLAAIEQHYPALTDSPRPWVNEHLLLAPPEVEGLSLPGRRMPFDMALLAGDQAVGLHHELQPVPDDPQQRRQSILHVHTAPVIGGEPRRLASLTLPPGLPQQINHPNAGTADDAAIYLALHGAGIAVFPFDGSPAYHLGEDEGLPSFDVSALAVHDNTLYLVCGVTSRIAFTRTMLLRYDLLTGERTVVASNARVDPLTPLDRLRRFEVAHLHLDAPRRRLVFPVYTSDRVDPPEAGIWAWNVDTDELIQLQHVAGLGPRYGGVTGKDQLLYCDTRTVWSFNLHNDELNIVHPIRMTRPFNAVLVDNQLWRLQPFGISQPDGTAFQPLPVPYDVKQQTTGHRPLHDLAYHANTHSIILGTRYGIWRFDLPRR